MDPLGPAFPQKFPMSGFPKNHFSRSRKAGIVMNSNIAPSILVPKQDHGRLHDAGFQVECRAAGCTVLFLFDLLEDLIHQMFRLPLRRVFVALLLIVLLAHGIQILDRCAASFRVWDVMVEGLISRLAIGSGAKPSLRRNDSRFHLCRPFMGVNECVML